MNVYQLTGYVYAIRSRSRPDLVYIGSTTGGLSHRMGMHLSAHNQTASKPIIEIGDAYIEMIDKLRDYRPEELLQRERDAILSMNCINKRIPLGIMCHHGTHKCNCKICNPRYCEICDKEYAGDDGLAKHRNTIMHINALDKGVKGVLEWLDTFVRTPNHGVSKIR